MSLDHVSRAARGYSASGQPVSFFGTKIQQFNFDKEKAMKENFGVIWTDEITQIEELEQKTAPSGSWE